MTNCSNCKCDDKKHKRKPRMLKSIFNLKECSCGTCKCVQPLPVYHIRIITMICAVTIATVNIKNFLFGAQVSLINCQNANTFINMTNGCLP